jgi:hypothetical protein
MLRTLFLLPVALGVPLLHADAQCDLGRIKDFAVTYETYADLSTFLPQHIVRVNIPPRIMACTGWKPGDPASFEVTVKDNPVKVLRIQPAYVPVAVLAEASSKALDPEKSISSSPLELEVVDLNGNDRIWRLPENLTPAEVVKRINQLTLPNGRPLVSASTVEETADGKTLVKLVIHAVADNLRSIRLRPQAGSAGDSEALPIVSSESAKDAKSTRTERVSLTSVAFLVLQKDAALETDAELVVKLKIGNDATGKSKPAKITASQYATLGIAPAWVPSQELNNGEKRPVAQFGTTIQIPVLLPGIHWARTYLKSESLFSTDAKDTSSSVSLLAGLERNLSGHHYVPFHLESKLLGDQVIDTLSSVTSAGFRALTPWDYHSGALYNKLYEIPVSPVWQFDYQFERRISRRPEQAQQYPNKNAHRFFGQMSLTPIRLLPGDATSNTLFVEFNLKGWWLPWDQHAGEPRKQRLEGLAEMSLVIPITAYTLKSGGMVASDPKNIKQRIRVKYSYGAQEAQGFAHTRSLSIGVEAIK